MALRRHFKVDDITIYVPCWKLEMHFQLCPCKLVEEQKKKLCKSFRSTARDTLRQDDCDSVL